MPSSSASSRTLTFIRTSLCFVGVAWLATSLALVHLTAPRAAAQPGDAPPTAATTPPRAPYLRRGDEVEQRYRAYRERLQRFFEALGEHLDKQAPKLRPKIVPPAPVPYGYQILPNLVPDPPRRPRPSRIILSRFSWSRTESLVERDRVKLGELEARLADAATSVAENREQTYDQLVGEYKKLVDGQKLIESTIQYNRLWQGEIVRYPNIYRDLTDLSDAVLARQALLDSLPLGDERMEADLLSRAEVLSQRIEGAIRKLPTPDFVRVDHPSPHRWILDVPVYTDVEDTAFLDHIRAAIEDAWHVRDGEDQFSVALDIRRVSAGSLYPGGSVPARGAHIDVGDHVRRFPPGGVVLTTGANTTYASGRSIILGPHAIGPSIPAHEFGHMLGFKDGYFRGYRDLGADGYEVIEVILDPDEVVSAPELGRVRREHFEQVLDEKRG